jgi:uncharacterized glyoxalase superfamily protein PhnB
MAADVWPGREKGPEQSTTVGLWVYVDDCGALWNRAIEAEGAELLMPMADMFWGDRMGKLNQQRKTPTLFCSTWTPWMMLRSL